MQQQDKTGIIEKAEKAADETERAQIKEELELKIANLQMEKDKVGQELTKDEIEKALRDLEDIDIDTIGGTVEGEYKGFGYIIDEENKVEVGEKIKGEKPIGQVVLRTTDEVALEVKLQVIAETKDSSTIEAIEAIDKEKVIPIDDETNGETSQMFKVEDNGKFTFRIKASNRKKYKNYK